MNLVNIPRAYCWAIVYEIHLLILIILTSSQEHVILSSFIPAHICVCVPDPWIPLGDEVVAFILKALSTFYNSVC